jgi:hypothetical protein
VASSVRLQALHAGQAGDGSGLGRCEVSAPSGFGSIRLQEPAFDEEEISAIGQGDDLAHVLLGEGAIYDIGLRPAVTRMIVNRRGTLTPFGVQS